jgi:hypothetical protein
VRKGAIFKKAFLIAITLGVAACFCAECCGINDNNTRGVGDNSGNYQAAAPQMAETGGFVPAPLPTYTPQMDYTPVQSAAQDGIQG